MGAVRSADKAPGKEGLTQVLAHPARPERELPADPYTVVSEALEELGCGHPDSLAEICLLVLRTLERGVWGGD